MKISSGRRRLLIVVFATIGCGMLFTAVLNWYSPSLALFIPLIVSLAALSLATVSTFKNELFEFELRIVPGDVTFSPSSSAEPIPIVQTVSFVNLGYGHGIIEWIALKISGPSGPHLYTPIAEIDYSLFVKMGRVHKDNMRGGFNAFILGAREAATKHVLLTPQLNDQAFPVQPILSGAHVFELYAKVNGGSSAERMSVVVINITQDVLDGCRAGNATLIFNRNVEVPGGLTSR